MAILSLAFKSLWNRKLTFFITLFSIAISVTLLLGVQTLKDETKTSFMKSISGTDLIIGARGASSQLLLSSVFHIGNTTNTLKYSSYEQIAKLPTVEWAVPISLGDSHKGYTVMATDLSFFEHYSYANKQKIAIQKGKISTDMFAVAIGADVAKKLNYKIGDSIIMTHGGGEIHGHDHDDIPYFISAILKPTFTAIDQTLIISLEAMEAMHADDHGHIGALSHETHANHDEHEHHESHANHDDHEHEHHESHASHDEHEHHESHASHDEHEHEHHESHASHDEHEHAHHESHASHDEHEHEHEHEHHESHANHDENEHHESHANHDEHEHEHHESHASHDEHEHEHNESHASHDEHEHEHHESHTSHDEHEHHETHANHDEHKHHQDTPEQKIARLLKLKPDNINAIFVGLTSRQSVLGMQRYVNTFQAEPLSAIMPAVALQELWQFFSIAETALDIVTIFVVLVGLLGMLSIILMSLNERRREMAILRSVGARPAHIFALIIGEAGFVCFAGIMLGIALMYFLLLTLQAPLATYYGFYLDINMLTSSDLFILFIIQASALLIALIPGLLIYRYSLSDGMSIKF
ncbi:hypothetical protein CW745_06110 [Psychromonas sp. psych-6C06]|uniref:ABC transporter permease n=1 Tax=Psychromonas sp. psych-6C06 TaxID=2058089 RepID=UPI000C31DFF5|nr:ABC transporter permease [Psychromonas sp. psych-6C06]PKF62997.1 hypothetical protein CW745_06110 [Psychromonas sp. psych-6C06]